MQDVQSAAHGLDTVLSVWRRRKWLSMLVFTALLTATLVSVRGLPNIYEASATVLLEQPRVPDRIVGADAAGALETRLHTITQEILSRSRLHELIVRFGLYPELRQDTPPEALADRMRRDIRLKFTEAPGGDWRNATIGYTISYRGHDPDTVAQVANALAALFIERNASLRDRQTSGTVELIRGQVERVKGTLADQERRIQEFKARYIGEFPEQHEANLAALGRLSEQLRLNIDMQLRLMAQRDELTGRLFAPVPPATTAAPDPRAVELARLRQELAQLRARLTDEHPDVIRLKSQIADLEAQRRVTPAPPPPAAANPAQQLARTLQKVEAELAALKREERGVRGRIAEYTRRVENTPRREQQLQQISRDYEATKQLYQSLLQRSEEAQLAERAGQGKYGEQFRILDPALPPRDPAAPERSRLLLAGLMMSAGAAVAAAMLAEMRDTSFHTIDDLRAATDVPVLISVPLIVSPADSRWRRRRFALLAAASVTGIAVVAGAAFYLTRNGVLAQLLAVTGIF